MSYTTDDFTESLQRVPLTVSDVDAVVAAWGRGNGMGEDAGHFKWADDGASEWNGGFLLRLTSGLYAYLTGWCEYTGWGCNDGAYVYHFDHEPSVDEMREAGSKDCGGNEPEVQEWDREPADLNRWLALHGADLGTDISRNG